MDNSGGSNLYNSQNSRGDQRNASIDSSRVVTKESTYLLKDIYNEV